MERSAVCCVGEICATVLSRSIYVIHTKEGIYFLSVESNELDRK